MQFYCADPAAAIAADPAAAADPSHHRRLRVLEVLAANRTDPFAVRRTCAELARLVLAAPGPAARAKLLAHPELLATLVDAAAEHVDAQELVLADCCRFLRRTIDLRAPLELDVQTRITGTGVLKLLARGLERHPQSTLLFSEVCRLVALLCFDMPFAPHADNQTDACAAGLLRAVCEHLRSKDSAVSIEEVQVGVDAITAMVYENETNAEEAVEGLQVLALLSSLLERSRRAPARVVQSVTQSLFQLLTLQPTALSEVLALGLLEQVIARLEPEGTAATPTARESLALWHALKFLEFAVRHNGKFPWQRAATAPALQYVACMLLSRVAVSESASEPTGGAPHKTRIDALVQSGAHELALAVLKKATAAVAAAGGTSRAGCRGSDGGDTAQALRLLELLASVDAHRIPLMRLGASRAIKVLYNGAETSAALRLLCERAVAAVEGT